MFDIFRKYLIERCALTEKELSLVQSLSVEKRLAGREYLLREGGVCRELVFVTRGLVRLYRIDKKGNEHIMRFAAENSWLSDRESYLSGQPSHSNIEAIEDSEILCWRKDDFDVLLKEIPALKQLMKALVTRNQIAGQNRIYTAISTSSEEKYLQFVEMYPTIFNRVPLHMVASYLGVTRETLSRIRRRHIEK
jgi:CRP-like cAMP-binding protein